MFEPLQQAALFLEMFDGDIFFIYHARLCRFCAQYTRRAAYTLGAWRCAASGSSLLRGAALR
jgi:hypothetical protein